jgi:hypothetical protein
MANGTIAFDTLSTSGQISGTARSVDTDYLAYGSAKAWANIQLDDTVMDNFNSSAFTDNGTGDITHSFSNNMGNINYVSIGFNIRNNDGGTAWCGGYGSDSEGDIKNTTSATRIQHFNASNSAEDMRRAMVTVHGDLA